MFLVSCIQTEMKTKLLCRKSVKSFCNDDIEISNVECQIKCFKFQNQIRQNDYTFMYSNIAKIYEMVSRNDGYTHFRINITYRVCVIAKQLIYYLLIEYLFDTHDLRGLTFLLSFLYLRDLTIFQFRTDKLLSNVRKPK